MPAHGNNLTTCRYIPQEDRSLIAGNRQLFTVGAECQPHYILGNYQPRELLTGSYAPQKNVPLVRGSCGQKLTIGRERGSNGGFLMTGQSKLHGLRCDVPQPDGAGITTAGYEPAVWRNCKCAYVGSLSTHDQDRNQTHTYTVSDSRFQILGSQLKLTNDSCLDALADDAVEIQVTTTDSGTPPRSFTRKLMIEVTENPFPWRYESQPADTNADGQIVPLDALWVINLLNNPTILDPGGRLPRSRAFDSTLPFYDVNGDGFCSPNDVLRIVNVLNTPSGETESTAEKLFADLEGFIPWPIQANEDSGALTTRYFPTRDEIMARHVLHNSMSATSRATPDDEEKPTTQEIPEASTVLSELECALEEIAADVLKKWLTK